MDEKEFRQLLDALYAMCNQVDGGDVDAWNLGATMVGVVKDTLKSHAARSWFLAWKHGEPLSGVPTKVPRRRKTVQAI